MSPLFLNYDRHSKASRFIISPASPIDVCRLVDIEFAAFAHERANQALSFRDHKKASHFERSVRLYEAALKTSPELEKPKKTKRGCSGAKLRSNGGEQTVKIKKVVDVSTGEIISFAKMEFKTYSLRELEQPTDLGHETEPTMNREWFGLNEQLRRDYNGTVEHCYIGMLATEPRHQHHGAGTLLLENILADADARGLEVYLEGTDVARPWYERHGFEAVNDLDFDPAKYGLCHLGSEHQTVMVRGALGLNGLHASVRSWEDAVADVYTGREMSG